MHHFRHSKNKNIMIHHHHQRAFIILTRQYSTLSYNKTRINQGLTPEMPLRYTLKSQNTIEHSLMLLHREGNLKDRPLINNNTPTLSCFRK